MSKELILTQETKDKIIQDLMHGKPLTQIAKDKNIPSLSKIYSLIAKDKIFANEISQARQIGAQTYIDQCIEELQSADNKSIMVLREKLQMCRWLASKLISIYGDKQQIIQDTKIEIQWNLPDNVNQNIIEVKSD